MIELLRIGGCTSIHNFRYMLRRAKTNVVIGSLAGLAWYFIHDQLLCPHGHATFYKSIAAHAVAGSLLYMAFWNPSNFFIGGVVGAFWGKNWLK